MNDSFGEEELCAALARLSAMTSSTRIAEMRLPITEDCSYSHGAYGNVTAAVTLDRHRNRYGSANSELKVTLSIRLQNVECWRRLVTGDEAMVRQKLNCLCESKVALIADLRDLYRGALE